MNTPLIIPFTLPEKSTNPPLHRVTGAIVVEGGSISIRFDGYGTHDCEGDNGAPIFIEVWNGELRLVVFPDISGQDPVVISLEQARIENLAE